MVSRIPFLKIALWQCRKLTNVECKFKYAPNDIQCLTCRPIFLCNAAAVCYELLDG